MIRQILNLFYKELIQFRRDRLLTPFVILGPVLQLLMLANATGTEMTNLRVGIYDGDRSMASRALATAFENAAQLEVRVMVASVEEGIDLLDRGTIRMLVVIQPGFSADLFSSTRQPALGVIYDGSNAIAAHTLKAAAGGALTAFGQAMAGSAGTTQPAVEVRSLAYYNPEMSFRYTSLPAQLGLIVYIVTMLVAAFGISRERERGTMEQLMVAPIRRSERSLGKPCRC